MLAERALLAWRERVAWRHPEWWIFAMSAIAWLTMLTVGGRAMTVHLPDSHAGLDRNAWQRALAGELGAWLLMVAAMMVPLIAGPIRAVAVRSLWHRRNRAMTAFLAGYIAVWLAFGLGVALARLTWPLSVMAAPMAAAAAFLFAALWHGAPMRRRAFASCHLTMPIAPAGWKADADCVQYGFAIGANCVVSCWALMLACALARHSPAAMLGITALMFFERASFRPRPAHTIVALVTMALVCTAIGGS
jgi:predicted metal-binding membrane protein